MVSLTEILFLAGLGFSLAAPLGPVNMEIIKRSIQSKFGFILGFITGIGAMTGDFIIASVVLYVGDEYLREIISNFWVYIILFAANIFILSYIGISALRAPTPEINKEEILNTETDDTEKLLSGVPKSDLFKQYSTGFVIVITSPWSYFWWTSFGGFILNAGFPLESLLERFIVTIYFLGGIFAWIFLLSGALGISRRFASPRILNIITKGSALIILGFAANIVYEGLIFLGVI